MIGTIISAIALVLFPISTYLVAKKLKNDAIDDVLGYFETEEGVKYVYKMGVIVGNGIKSGVGIGTKGGKFKMEDLIGQGLGMFLQSLFPSSEQQNNGVKNTPQRPERLNRNNRM